MNKKIFDLIGKIIDSDLPKETRDQITRFYMLPRATKLKPPIELPDATDEPNEPVETEEAGPIKRPDEHSLKRRADPEMAAEEDATKKTLEGRIDGT